MARPIDQPGRPSQKLPIPCYIRPVFEERLSDVADSMNGEKQVIVLGPRGSGKTALVLDMIDAVTHGGHGYPDRVHLGLKASTGSPATIEQLKRDPQYWDELAAEKNESLRKSGPPATARDYVLPRKLILEYQDGGAPEKLTVVVIDPAGDHFFPVVDGSMARKKDQPPPGEDPLPKHDNELMDGIAGAAGLVIVASCAQVGSPGFANQLNYVLEVFAKRHSSKLNNRDDKARVTGFDRVVIAVSKIDFAFMPFGRYSGILAANPDFARMVLSDLLQTSDVRSIYQNNILRHTREYGGPFDIKLVPTSSFGFHPVTGHANIDPKSPAPSLANRTDPSAFPEKVVGGVLLNDEEETEDEASPDAFTRFPFLTADPVVYAATGLTGRFHFDLRELLGSDSPPIKLQIDPVEPIDAVEPSAPVEPFRVKRFAVMRRMVAAAKDRVRQLIREFRAMQDGG